MEGNTVSHITFLTLLLIGFFGLVFISGYMTILFFAIIFFMGWEMRKSEIAYSKLIRWFLLFLIVSCVYSWRFNGQRPQAFLPIYDYFAISYFFVLLKLDPSYDETQKVLERIAIWFCVCYILQWFIYPVVLFNGANDELNVNAYQFRMRMPGSICGYFLLLHGIGKYLLEKDVKYFFYSFLGFIPVLVQGFRSLVALSALAIVLMSAFILRSRRKIILYIFLGIGVLSVAMTTDIVQSKMAEMMERQNTNQSFDNDDYIRILSFEYYWNQQFIKPYEKIIGGGVPVDTKSSYYKTIDAAKERFGYYWSDLGYVGLCMVIGLPTVFFLICMYVRCMWRCKEPELQSLRFTLFIVFVGSLVTAEIYREGNLLMLSLFLYIEYKYHQEQETIGHQIPSLSEEIVDNNISE